MSDLLKVGALGMGNAGGNVAEQAVREGFKSVALNASTNDLDALSEAVTKFPIGDGRGTGKSRVEARSFMESQLGILDDIKMAEFVNTSDVIIVVSSIGGGFGSGAAPYLATELKTRYPSKCIIPCGVFPFDSEGYTAQDHGVQWLKEVKEPGIFSYLLYDNNRFSHMTPKDAVNSINNEIIDFMKILRGDYTLPDITGGIDQRDMMTLISPPGRIAGYVRSIEEADIINGSIVETMLKMIKDNSGLAELASDKQIMASAIQYSLHDNFREYLPQVKNDVQEICGSHLSDYSNFHNAADDEDVQDFVAIIMSGLSDPTLRIDKMINRRDKLAGDILNRKQAQSKLNQTTSGDPRLQLSAASFATGAVTKKVPVPNTDKEKK